VKVPQGRILKVVVDPEEREKKVLFTEDTQKRK
jgi:hypothetical protein